MHPRQLVEIAGPISLRAALLLEGGATVCSDSLAEYWIASRCRIDCWGRSLRSLGHSQTVPPDARSRHLLIRLVEEIQLSIPLARVMVAICSASDRTIGESDAEPIAHNLLDAHHEAAERLNVLTSIWWSRECDLRRQERLLVDRTRRWNDALLGQLSLVISTEHLAFDRRRLRRFASEAQAYRADLSSGASPLLSLAIRASFAVASHDPLNPLLNKRIAGAAHAIFGNDGFDDHGLAYPPWMLRAARLADDSIAMIDKVFRTDRTAPTLRPHVRWRS